MEEVENGPTFSNEQKQLYKDRLNDLNTKKQARLDYHKIEKILKHKSQRLNTLEKVLDKNTPLPESILLYLNS